MEVLKKQFVAINKAQILVSYHKNKHGRKENGLQDCSACVVLTLPLELLILILVLPDGVPVYGYVGRDDLRSL